MIDKEIFQRAVFLVSKETGVDQNEILSHSHKCDQVDARYLLVKLLSDIGFSTTSISFSISQTSRSVTDILTKFEERTARSILLRKKHETLRKYLLR